MALQRKLATPRRIQSGVDSASGSQELMKAEGKHRLAALIPQCVAGFEH